jgi:hypothetical protein
VWTLADLFSRMVKPETKMDWDDKRRGGKAGWLV